MDVTEVIINDPDFDEGEITKWLKKDNDFVLEGEPLAEAIGFRLLAKQIGNIYSSLPHSMAFSKIRTLGKTFTLNAKSSGRLKILVLPAQPVMQSTIIAKIEKVDGLDKYLTSQQEQLSSQDFTLKQHSNVIDVFYSYDPQDEMLRKELEKHLRNLRSQNIIADWHDRNITAGTEWQRVISSHLDTAHLILLLVSPDFMASDYRYSIEMQRAMQRHPSGEARVVPILLRPVDWKGAPFASLQILPSTGQPITLWPDRDDAFVNIVREIRNIIQKLLEERLQPLQEQHQAINL